MPRPILRLTGCELKRRVRLPLLQRTNCAKSANPANGCPFVRPSLAAFAGLSLAGFPVSRFRINAARVTMHPPRSAAPDLRQLFFACRIAPNAPGPPCCSLAIGTKCVRSRRQYSISKESSRAAFASSTGSASSPKNRRDSLGCHAAIRLAPSKAVLLARDPN